MNATIRKHRRTILVIFSVFLMISFLIVPGGGGADPVAGTALGRKIHFSEVQRMHDHWKRVSESYFQSANDPRTGEQGQVPMSVARLGPFAAESIRQDNELFFLLREEALSMGVNVTQEEVDQVLQNSFTIEIDRTLGRPTRRQLSTVSGEALRTARAAVADLLIIERGLHRYLAFSTPSRSAVERRLQMASRLEFGIVEIECAPLVAGLPTPSDDDLQAHFRAYADRLEGNPDDANLFGFGYQIPNQVRFEYLKIDRERVRQAVRAQETDLTWRTRAYRFYNENQKKFEQTSVDPASESPVSLGPIGLGLTPPKPSVTTTRPFEEVESTILQTHLLDPETDKLAAEVRRNLSARLSQHFREYREGKRPDYATPAYLLQIVADFVSEFGVELVIGPDEADRVLLTRAQIEQRLPTVAAAGPPTADSRLPKLSQYATEHVRPLMKNVGEAELVIDVLQPADALKDSAGNYYVFRVVEAVPAHAPADWTALRGQLLADYQRKAAMAKARAEGEALAQSAQADGLEAAAARASKLMARTGSVEYYTQSTGAYATTPANARRIWADVPKLLEDAAAAGNLRRPRVVELPGEHGIIGDRAAVVQILTFEGLGDEDRRSYFLSEAGRVLRGEDAIKLSSDWADPEDVRHRTGWKQN